MDNQQQPTNRLEELERWLKFSKDLFIIFSIVAAVVYFLPAFKGLRDKFTVTSLSLGPFSLQLKERIDKFASVNVSMEVVGGPSSVIQKGSYGLLYESRHRLQGTKGARIDVVLITPDKQYSGEMLQKYISLLNAKFIVFQQQRLDGWMDAGGFSVQLDPHRVYSYEDLKHDIVGVSTDSVQKSESAESVLEKMQESHLDNLAVVDTSGNFQFMVSRQEILSRIVVASILQAK